MSLYSRGSDIFERGRRQVTSNSAGLRERTDSHGVGWWIPNCVEFHLTDIGQPESAIGNEELGNQASKQPKKGFEPQRGELGFQKQKKIKWDRTTGRNVGALRNASETRRKRVEMSGHRSSLIGNASETRNSLPFSPFSS